MEHIGNGLYVGPETAGIVPSPAGLLVPDRMKLGNLGHTESEDLAARLVVQAKSAGRWVGVRLGTLDEQIHADAIALHEKRIAAGYSVLAFQSLCCFGGLRLGSEIARLEKEGLVVVVGTDGTDPQGRDTYVDRDVVVPTQKLVDSVYGSEPKRHMEIRT